MQNEPLEETETINGNLDQRSRLDRLFGRQLSPFGTYDKEIFEKNLDAMNYAQLQAMASRVGINPYIDEPRLRIALQKQFNAERRETYDDMPKPIPTRKLDATNPEHAKLIKGMGWAV